jgi:hypothetical protein
LADEAQPTLAMFTLGSAVQPGPMPSYPDVPNPVGIEAARSLLRVLVSLSEVCLLVVWSARPPPSWSASGAPWGLERQQLKWLGYAGAVAMEAMLAWREWAGWAMVEVVALMAGDRVHPAGHRPRFSGIGCSTATG